MGAGAAWVGGQKREPGLIGKRLGGRFQAMIPLEPGIAGPRSGTPTGQMR
jgi:hypothetical protein